MMAPQQPPDADRAYLRTLTLLYVEDDELTRQQMELVLRRRVGRLVVATDGIEGMLACRKELPDLVVTDIQMPAMDGLTMAQEIRALAPSMPIIVTTAFEQSDYSLRSIEIGIDRYIVKPVDLGRLDAALTVCAHRLRAERLLAKRRELEAEQRRQQAISVLAAGIAHDYNNMLQTILGNVSLARLVAPPQVDLALYLEHAEASASEAGALGHKLAILANAGMNKLKEVPLVPLISAVLRDATEDTAVVCEVALAEDLPPAVQVTGDVRLLTALFAHLAVNAIEAMPDGGTLSASLSVATLAAGDGLPLPPGDYLHVALHDTGHGIAPKVLPRIFEPYFTTKERSSARGVGLGLAMCRTIVEKHHGLLTVDGQVPSGATFHVYLPLSPA